MKGMWSRVADGALLAELAMAKKLVFQALEGLLPV
jgi:hypothetical protein